MEATDKEKIWWVEGTYPSIKGEGRIIEVFAEKFENAKAGRFWDYDNGIVTIIELPYGDHEVAIIEFNRQIFDQFRNVASRDNIRGWEAKTLEHVKDKINNFWLGPNCCENVFVIKLGNWSNKRHNLKGQPMRHLRVQYCSVLSQTFAPGVAIDLYEIQQAIFDAMDKN
ncbi:25087_t:CDS:2 [Gigaspora rosea]|nr:25087_t:CDS:2 [Gigaspora rosea]